MGVPARCSVLGRSGLAQRLVAASVVVLALEVADHHAASNRLRITDRLLIFVASRHMPGYPCMVGEGFTLYRSLHAGRLDAIACPR